MVDGQKVRAMVMIMRTNGCCWVKHGGCTMCGYKEASLMNVTPDDLLKQLEQDNRQKRVQLVQQAQQRDDG